MIAFLKWHCPGGQVLPDAYDASLRTFHHTLTTRKPKGFAYAVPFRCDRVPWFTAAETIYLDWYLMHHSAGLDALQDAAVSGACEAPHADLADRAVPEVATGLYRHRLGPCALRQATCSYWFTKPSTMKHDDLLRILHPLTTAHRVDLWIRYLGLSPAPEFCLVVAENASLPDALEEVDATVSRVAAAFIKRPLTVTATSYGNLDTHGNPG